MPTELLKRIIGIQVGDFVTLGPLAVRHGFYGAANKFCVVNIHDPSWVTIEVWDQYTLTIPVEWVVLANAST